MISQDARKILSVALSFILVTTSSQILYGYQTATSPPPADSGNPTDPAPQSATELQSLVAPIALYPDALLAQILMAAAYPLEVVKADRWLQDPSHANLRGDQLAGAIEAETWDPSVKSLVPFPQILRDDGRQARGGADGSRPSDS